MPLQIIMEIIATIILGSNKGDRLALLDEAVCNIEKEIGFVCEKSSVFESEPWGYDDKTSYYNQVVKVKTALEPEALLQSCLKIETLLGRKRSGTGYEARTMDIDILFFGDEVIHSETLIIPHEHIASRKFVLMPLAEIMPDFQHPVLKKSMKDLLEACQDIGWVIRY